MAAIDDLIVQIEDTALRARIRDEVNRINKQKKFGIVFEEHLPEGTPLYDIPVKSGSLVAKKSVGMSVIYTVQSIIDGFAKCLNRATKELEMIAVDELVSVAEFGEPIYPYLKPIDSVCNAPDSDLWHVLIEADNYHALQLLEYLYAGKVDCIYIDPPYNTGAKDWKYNNDYVDGSDAYRHSKWLSMMQKRLVIAKKLLVPNNSILIVTIDEKEYLHLGCLLEELFPEAKIQMISSVINRAGTGRKNEFSRTDEYLFFVRFGEATIASDKTDTIDKPVTWDTLRRSGPTNTWDKTKTQFYPIFVDDKTKRVHSIGKPLIFGQDRIEDVIPPAGCTAVYPIRDNGKEMMWGCKGEEFLERLKCGYIRIGRFTPEKPQKYVISYLTGGIIQDIANGKAEIRKTLEDGSVDAYYVDNKDIPPTTNWQKPTHDAQWYGSNLLKLLLGDRFLYPKSLYAVRDSLDYCVRDNKNAVILDFFAGSGTTLHAVNLLNAEDGGQRRCILVTNNEVSVSEATNMSQKGLKPGDKEWEKYGIAHYVTWPRTVCSIEGHDINNNPLKDNYLGSELPMSEGFKANAAFFKLGFLDKNEISLGYRFKEMLPLLWMKAGANGYCPHIEDCEHSMLIFPDNRFAVLLNEKNYLDFIVELDKHPEIKTVYFVTDSNAGYRDMIVGMEDKKTYQLYRDYLDNFRINISRR